MEGNPLSGVKASQVLTGVVSALLALLAFMGHGALEKIERLYERMSQAEASISTMHDRSANQSQRLERIENKVDKLLERNFR